MNNLIACAALLAALALPMAPQPVEATNFAWTVGGAFRIGGAQFHITMRDGYYGGPSYFYRTPRHIGARGYSCHGACYRSRGNYYHHPYCPVAEAYFHTHGFTSYDLFVRHAPTWSGHLAYGTPWGPYFAPGRAPRIHTHFGYWTPPGHYAYYGPGNPDRRGARYEPWDRRNKKQKQKHGKGHYDD